MLCIQNNSTDPYFNLAAEEYLLRNFKENCFMLWRNKPSIIVGKHQNALAEINYEYVKENNINVIRRLSGGGTVFHDLGNLNFTFIQNVNANENLVDFKKYIKPIVAVLNQLGINAKHEGRNDIMIDGKKVSGNAEHVFKRRVLHHGTLLFSSVISDLSKALKVNPLKYQDKGVKSVKSRVTNISECLPNKISVLEFQDKILSYIKESEPNIDNYIFSKTDIDQINKLVKDKYLTWDWNYGYSPKYSFEKTIKISHDKIEIQMNVEKGIIADITIKSDSIDKSDVSFVEQKLIGINHEEHSIFKALSDIPNNRFLKALPLSKFIKSLF
ncbi:MAG: lipoate--protein ligase [Bacteroidales bacterium]|nr:lipoate--protein ligase [Bacteroidales bacterium]